MKQVASMFTEEERAALREHLSIELSDEHDYTEDELSDMYDQITDKFPYEYDKLGDPIGLGVVYDDIIDTFLENNLID